MLREGAGSRAEQMVKGGMLKSKVVILQLLAGATSLASGALAQARGTPTNTSATGVSASAHDLAFVELEAYFSAQAPLVATLYSACAVLSNRYREQAQLLLSHGSALRDLGISEGGALGDSVNIAGVASWAASTTAYEQAVCQTETVVERLADLVRAGRAVKEALVERARASAQLTDMSNEVDRLRAHITALTNSPAPNAGRDRAVAEADISVAQRQATEARAYYDKVAQAFLADAARYRAAMTSDFRELLMGLASTQLRTEEKLKSAWESSSARLGGVRPVAALALMS